MPTVTKKELIDRIAVDTGLSRADVKKSLQAFLDQVIAELAEGNRLELRDFGIFEPKHRAPRTAQNPRTLERVEVPARRTVKFKPGRKMQQTLEEKDKLDPLKVVVRPDRRPEVHVAAGRK